MADQKVTRVVQTRRFYDRQRNPPDYVDEELPTTTIKLKGALGRVVTRAPRGTIAEGSYRITGSRYEFSPGTYSLRIVRLSLGVIGSSNFQGTVFQWHLRHSRQGTVDVQCFGEQGRVLAVGGPRSPIYSLGPGTAFWGWDTFKGELGTQLNLIQSMEAIPG